MNKNNRIITYEYGSPLEYKHEFSKLWLEHMSYISSIKTIPYNVEFTQEIFNSSLSKFMIKNNSTKLFVAKESNKMVGFLQAGIRGRVGILSDLHIKESYRGNDIGSNLINKCIDWFSRYHMKNIELEVAGGNEMVLGFYANHGFQIESYKLVRKL